jgi:predicted membrane protein
VSPRLRGLLRLAVLLAVAVVLFLLFPAALAFAEQAARQIRYLWWLILLVALAIWLIWGVGRRPRNKD